MFNSYATEKIVEFTQQERLADAQQRRLAAAAARSGGNALSSAIAGARKAFARHGDDLTFAPQH